MYYQVYCYYFIINTNRKIYKWHNLLLYTMKITIPNKAPMGTPVEGAMKRVLDKQGAQKPSVIQPTNAPNVDGFIYVPSIGIYVAKERTLKGENWPNTHEKLNAQNLRMPTIPQFIEFLKYIKTNSQYEQIYREITEVREPRRAEWLDARFEEQNGKMHIHYNHRTINGELIPQNSEPLENCLMQDCYANILASANKQGLPTKETKRGFYYWFPRNNFVAGFIADSGMAGLDWGRDPQGSDSSLGVFACAAGGAAGGKKKF